MMAFDGFSSKSRASAMILRMSRIALNTAGILRRYMSMMLNSCAGVVGHRFLLIVVLIHSKKSMALRASHGLQNQCWFSGSAASSKSSSTENAAGTSKPIVSLLSKAPV